MLIIKDPVYSCDQTDVSKILLECVNGIFKKRNLKFFKF